MSTATTISINITKEIEDVNNTINNILWNRDIVEKMEELKTRIVSTFLSNNSSTNQFGSHVYSK